ncbi:hypothetical protein D3C71_156440 [compost metagenome]
MNREELIEHGRDALAMAREACFLNPDTLSHPDRISWAEELFDGLSERLSNDYVPPNPDFRNQDELAAAMIVLASYDQETYRSIFQFCFEEFHGDLSTVHGLSNLDTILRLLSDDHNLCLNLDGPTPVLGNEAYFPGFVRGASPVPVLEAIRPYAEAALAPSVSPR